MLSTEMEISTNAHLKQTNYLVKNCKYNWGFKAAGGFDVSVGEISKYTVKHVFLSRLHNFHAVVFPCPMTVSAMGTPFCEDRKYQLQIDQPISKNLSARNY